MLFYRYRHNKRLKRLHQIHHHKVNRMHQHEKRHLIKPRHSHQTDKLRRWNDWHLYHHVSALFNQKSNSSEHNKNSPWRLSIREQLKRAPNSHARQQILQRYNQRIVNRRKLESIFHEKEVREEQLRQARLPMVIPQPRSGKANQTEQSASVSHDEISKADLIQEIHHINQILGRLEKKTGWHQPLYHAQQQKPLVVKSHKRGKTDPARQMAATLSTRPKRSHSWVEMVYHGFQIMNGIIWCVLIVILIFIAYLIISR